MQGKKTGGRQKGSRNKATAAKEKAIADSGLTPLDYMISVMRDTNNEPHVRMDAAKAAAPYVHPKLANIEHTGKDGGPITITTDKERALALRALMSRLPSAGD